MPSYVTRVTLTATKTPSRLDITAVPDMVCWRVQWTLSTNGREQEFAQSHYSETAARRHANNLLNARRALNWTG